MGELWTTWCLYLYMTWNPLRCLNSLQDDSRGCWWVLGLAANHRLSQQVPM